MTIGKKTFTVLMNPTCSTNDGPFYNLMTKNMQNIYMAIQ